MCRNIVECLEMLGSLIKTALLGKHCDLTYFGKRLLQKRISVCGIDLAYEIVGEGPAVVALLPGALGTARTDFQCQLNNLNRDKFTLISWDPPGYGASRPPERDFQQFYYKDAEVFGKLMKTLGHEKYSVIGWSDGAITGFILASKEPDSVQKLVAIGGRAFITDNDRATMIAFEDVSKLSPRMREPLEQIYGLEKLQLLWSALLKTLRSYEDICKEQLWKIQCPTLIVHGEKDPVVSITHADYLLQNIKNASIYRFPEGGHNVHQRFFKEFNHLSEKFILNE